MAQKSINDVRTALAELGVELTPTDLNEVLQAAAAIAVILGGKVWVDTDDGWEIFVGIDEENPGECWVDIGSYLDNDEIQPEEAN